MTDREVRHSVLIVDDNPDLLKLLFFFLQNRGIDVMVADSGPAALERVSEKIPDIILLDVLMPGMDGFETLQKLKEKTETKDVPVIFMTALSDTVNKLKGFRAGVVDYITKPCQNEEVMARIKTHLTIRELQQDLEKQNQKLKEENIRRRRIQDALRDSRERYRLLAENSTDMIARQRPDGTYVYMSPACLLVLGYPVEEMINRHEVDFSHPDDVGVIEEIIGSLEQRPEKISYTYRARHKDGHYVWLETTSSLVRDGNTKTALELISVSRNITDRKRAEEALQRAHDELEIRVQERTAELVALNRATQRFVPNEFLFNLGKKSIMGVRLGDQVQRDMTIFCSDLRNFTGLSEKLESQEIFNFLNTYYGRISPLVRRHQGFIDKYIGDAIMALFPGDVGNAIEAAIAIQQEIGLLNNELKRDGIPPVGSGTGIHRGDLMLGTIGEEQRMETTVISDSVNLAFRLEGLTKIYGARIIVSQDALFSMEKPGSYRFRFLDRVRVKGKNKPVSVFEIFDGDPPEIGQFKADTLDSFERGLLHYYNQEFGQAQSFFRQVLDHHPHDRAAELYLMRAEYFDTHGVSSGWEGISTLDIK
jgi:two-component system sensor histidine kinase ChiS